MNVVAPGRVEQGLGGEDQGTFSFLLAPVGEVYDFDIRFSGTWAAHVEHQVIRGQELDTDGLVLHGFVVHPNFFR